MSKNIDQVFIANPITSNASTDLMYFGQSPYGITNDAAMTYANFAAQFGAAYTASALTKTDDTNVTLTLGGTPATSLLHAASLTLGWTGTLSGTRGGTGSNNGASTITIGGNVAFSGAHTFAGTLTNNTSVTFPTSGTLATVTGNQNQSYVYSADTGTANAYVATPSPAVTSYIAGLRIVLNVANANSGASTLNVSGLGTKAITSTAIAALASGQMGVGMLAELEYDGTQFQLLNPIAASGGASPWTAGSGTDSAYGGGATDGGDDYTLAWGNGAVAEGTGAVSLIGNARAASTFALAIGQGSVAAGTSSYALGSAAFATYRGSYVWSDYTAAGNTDTGVDQYVRTATGGFYDYAGSQLIYQATTNGVINLGTQTNDSAASGYIGEYISSTVLVGAQVSVTSNSAKDITSISLTAGDWDVYGNVVANAATGTVPSNLLAWISTTSATLPTYPNAGGISAIEGVTMGTASTNILQTGHTRISVATTTTVYLSTYMSFTVSTMGGYGFIGARRAR